MPLCSGLLGERLKGGIKRGCRPVCEWALAADNLSRPPSVIEDDNVSWLGLRLDWALRNSTGTQHDGGSLYIVSHPEKS